MDKYICIHGHFYQPPRENPWLNEVELQDSAYPYHDWNERITSECYARNAASRILDDEGRITDIINNYEYISFNFGPTLLEWMEKKAPKTYKGILEADKRSMKRFSGHGAALAQSYNHMIMPLANSHDQETQVIWGIRDFEYRFRRKPEGMWLAETAVNTDTLEVLAAHDIKFTILSPYQARQIRKKGDKNWKDATGARIDPRRPYRCKLPSGRHIDLFFYDGPVSQGIAFEGLLNSGEAFASRLLNQLDLGNKAPQLMHIATDGETYGHHHNLGEMALSYCLQYIEKYQPVKISIYGEYLEKFPPDWEVEIIENSSWSCAHGVERWRSNCGCKTGGLPHWHQEWREPLRDALDWLRDKLISLFEEELRPYTHKPWQLRNKYIEVILDRSEANIENFFADNIGTDLSQQDKIKVLKLLEMQYHCMLMYTSCGWFFDEVSGIETMQDVFYAARAMQLALDINGIELETTFMQKLEKANSNLPEYGNAANAYLKLVKPAILDLTRVAAHYAVSSLFTNYPEEGQVYSYTAKSETQELMEAGKEKLLIGRAILKSRTTWEQDRIAFAILHMGEHHMFGGVREFQDEENFKIMQQEIKMAFDMSNVFEVILLMDKHFGSHNYSFWHLFKDDQQKVLNQVLAQNTENLERQFMEVYDNNYALIQAVHHLKQPLPTPLHATVDFVINARMRRLLEAPRPNLGQLRKLMQEMKRTTTEVKLDTLTLNFMAAEQISGMTRQLLQEEPENSELISLITETIKLLKEAGLKPDLWWAQNYGYQLKPKKQPQMVFASDEKENFEQRQPDMYHNLFKTLNIKA